MDTPVKKWSNITPTLLGSDYNRYEISIQAEGRLFVYVKMPSKGMHGCDRCAGPHKPTNKWCSKTRRSRPNIPAPINHQGIYLYDLNSGDRLPGVWKVQNWKQKMGQVSAVAELLYYYE